MRSNHYRIGAELIYGSRMPGGFVNTDRSPSYTPVDMGMSHEFKSPFPDLKPRHRRFDVVNVFNTVYEIRDGTGACSRHSSGGALQISWACRGSCDLRHRVAGASLGRLC